MKRSLLALPLVVLVVVASCLDNGPAFQPVAVTGVVTDIGTGAPIVGASVDVEFGQCATQCVFQGSPGTGPTDSLGHYAVNITGPIHDCDGFFYFVHVNAGSKYLLGSNAFPCGTQSQQLDFAMHGVTPYAFSGTITFLASGSAISGATVVVGLFATGTTCLATSNTCSANAIASMVADPAGKYSFNFSSVNSAADCAGKEFVVFVPAGPGYSAGEGRIPCGQTTAVLNLALAQP